MEEFVNEHDVEEITPPATVVMVVMVVVVVVELMVFRLKGPRLVQRL